MITRPLDLSSKLRPEPRNFDWLFFANAGLLALFFSVFGSRFVLAPGISVNFRLPSAVGAEASARRTTHMIDVSSADQILTEDGTRTMLELKEWLRVQALATKSPVLLVRFDTAKVPVAMLMDIYSAAAPLGFEVQLAAEERVPAGSPSSAPKR
jgi:biopolymer transport protein ExbD